MGILWEPRADEAFSTLLCTMDRLPRRELDGNWAPNGGEGGLHPARPPRTSGPTSPGSPPATPVAGAMRAFPRAIRRAVPRAFPRAVITARPTLARIRRCEAIKGRASAGQTRYAARACTRSFAEAWYSTPRRSFLFSVSRSTSPSCRTIHPRDRVHPSVPGIEQLTRPSCARLSDGVLILETRSSPGSHP